MLRTFKEVRFAGGVNQRAGPVREWRLFPRAEAGSTDLHHVLRTQASEFATGSAHADMRTVMGTAIPTRVRSFLDTVSENL